jgi:hypothetical protein
MSTDPFELLSAPGDELRARPARHDGHLSIEIYMEIEK